MRLKTDWILFLTILAMTALGLVMVYSASIPFAEIRKGQPHRFRHDELADISNVTVDGTTTDYPAVQNSPLKYGRMFTAGDDAARRDMGVMDSPTRAR